MPCTVLGILHQNVQLLNLCCTMLVAVGPQRLFDCFSLKKCSSCLSACLSIRCETCLAANLEDSYEFEHTLKPFYKAKTRIYFAPVRHSEILKGDPLRSGPCSMQVSSQSDAFSRADPRYLESSSPHVLTWIAFVHQSDTVMHSVSQPIVSRLACSVEDVTIENTTIPTS